MYLYRRIEDDEDLRDTLPVAALFTTNWKTGERQMYCDASEDGSTLGEGLAQLPHDAVLFLFPGGIAVDAALIGQREQAHRIERAGGDWIGAAATSGEPAPPDWWVRSLDDGGIEMRINSEAVVAIGIAGTFYRVSGTANVLFPDLREVRI